MSGSQIPKLTASSPHPRWGSGRGKTPGLRGRLPGPHPRGRDTGSAGPDPRPQPRCTLAVAALEARSLPGRARLCGSPGEAAARPGGGSGRGPASRAVHKCAGRAATAVRSAAGRWPRGWVAPRPVRRAPGSGRARSPSHAVLAHAARALQPAQSRQLPAVRGSGRGPRAGSRLTSAGRERSGRAGDPERPRRLLTLCPLGTEGDLPRLLPGTDRPTLARPDARSCGLAREAGLQNLVLAGLLPRRPRAGAERTSLGRNLPGVFPPLRLSSPRSRRRGNFLPSVWSCPGKSGPLLFAPLRPGPSPSLASSPVSLVRPRGERAVSAALRSA